MNFGHVGQSAIEGVDILDKVYLNKIECKYYISFLGVGYPASMKYSAGMKNYWSNIT